MRESMKQIGGKTARLTGTAILAALVLIFDYSLKFSGLKIPFPWMPFLKFDFTGIPIIISLLLYGLTSAATTSAVACLGIIVRSGDLIGGAMKGIAEFSTVMGMAYGIYLASRLGLEEKYWKTPSIINGVSSRIIIMSIWNLIVLPNYYGLTLNATVSMLPLLGFFNGIQGIMTAFLGYLFYEAYTKNMRARSFPS